MDNSDLMKLFAKAAREAGNIDYANQLDNSAAVYEAEEISREESKKEK